MTQAPQDYRIEFERIARHEGDIACAEFSFAAPGGEARRVEVQATDWLLDVFLKESGQPELTPDEEERLLAETGQRAIIEELKAGRTIGPVVRFNSMVFEDPAEVRAVLAACGIGRRGGLCPDGSPYGRRRD